MTRESKLPLRLVLDTNVWLDWLVFDDAGVVPLRQSVMEKRSAVFIDDACASELQSVLAYPLRRQILPAAAQAACMTECRRIAVSAITPDAGEGPFAGPLPVCRDADDQKFLELARACRADYLITKDALLLELARRKVRRAPFGIITPAQFSAMLDSAR